MLIGKWQQKPSNSYFHIMINQRVSLLLILIMLVTPVTSVFSYYLTVVNQLSSEKVIHIAASLADDAVMNTEPCPQHHKSKLSCDTNGLCSFSVCGYGNIPVTFLLLAFAFTAHRYRQIKKIFLRSRTIPPEIKPPIFSF